MISSDLILNSFIHLFTMNNQNNDFSTRHYNIWCPICQFLKIKTQAITKTLQIYKKFHLKSHFMRCLWMYLLKWHFAICYITLKNKPPLSLNPLNFPVSMSFGLHIQEISQSRWVSVSTSKKFLSLDESQSRHPINLPVSMSLGLNIHKISKSCWFIRQRKAKQKESNQTR